MFEKIEVSQFEVTNIVHIKNALDSDTCKEIVRQVLAYKEQTPPSPDTSENCWRGDPHINGGLNEEIVLKLRGLIAKGYEFYQSTMPAPKTFAIAEGIKNQYNMDDPRISAWFNVNNSNGGNMIHIHAGSYLSGCLYFQSTSTGYIEFYTQNYMYRNMHPCWPYFGSAKYFPEDGDLILFPSYLAHYVEPNPSIRQRINMAFNIEIGKK